MVYLLNFGFWLEFLTNIEQLAILISNLHFSYFFPSIPDDVV